MTDRADEQTPQDPKTLPLGLQLAVGLTASVVVFAALDPVPGGPWNLWGGLIHIGGSVVHLRLVHQSVTLRLEERPVR
ncbi:hypothetical protein GMA12_11985 [Kocuria sediminis]|uniref:Uncharacterized protein n=1 Tax=Kocuria sediminis TaxID=1038857 RepID=A0A6N8GNP4_9MICC|nr:hypothetical protein [Kocuria sediminis]MUN63847.1 hypothetical protein [Kocuria sediminis]